MKKQMILIGISVFLSVPLSYADDIAIIVGANVDINQLNAKQVQRIFLRKDRITGQGERWVPANLETHQPLRKIFSTQLLKKNTFELERYWNEQYFNGISPPYVLASEEAVLRFVSQTPYALGYILSCHVDARVKVVYSFRIKNQDNPLCH